MDIGQFLARRNVPFQTLATNPAAGLSDLANTQYVPHPRIARCELLRTGDGFIVAVFPVAYEVCLEALETLLGVRPISRATRQDFERVFPGISGDMAPPFGAEFGVRTVVDIHLASCANVIFKSPGLDAVQLSYDDFERLENPITGRFAFLHARPRPNGIDDHASALLHEPEARVVGAPRGRLQ